MKVTRKMLDSPEAQAAILAQAAADGIPAEDYLAELERRERTMREAMCKKCGGWLIQEGDFCLDCRSDLADEATDLFLEGYKDLRGLAQDKADLLAALKAVEWAGCGGGEDDVRGDVCPNCGAYKEHGHKSDCELAAALALAKAD